MKTLKEYLKENIDKGAIDHDIRCRESDGDIIFYIHPHGVNGDTLDFKAIDNQLIPLQ